MGVSERREQERHERTQRILEAALRVFAREGLRPATIEAIAGEAQLGKGTIYYYFSSKEALLEELVANLSDEYFRGLLAGASGHATPLAIAQGIVERLIEHYRGKPELFRVIHMVLGEPEPRPQKALEAFVDSHLSWIENLKDETAEVLQAHGVPEDAFLYLVSTFSHGVLFEAVSGRDPDRLLNETRVALEAFLASFSGTTS
ncbi:MAG: TetR/AcrR family transcriptional regulator [Candidatus Bipolaricaulia bacterium]